MKQSEVALVTKYRVLEECWEIMATAAEVTGHCVCRWVRSSMPLPQSTQARLDERHSAIPPREKLRVRPQVGRALCVSRHACYRSWAGRRAGPRLWWMRVAVSSGKVVADPARVQLLHLRAPGVLSCRPSSVSTSLKVPSGGMGADNPLEVGYGSQDVGQDAARPGTSSVGDRGWE